MNSLPASPLSARTSGFTLLEVAIVSAIIAIIVGGILVGSDMIKSAGARRAVAQYTAFESATKAFEEKYQTFPGDMSGEEAAQIGFVPTTRDATAGNTIKHNNSWIEPGGGADLKHAGMVSFVSITDFELGITLGYESLLFWQDLSSAHMIDANFSSLTTDDTSALVITSANANLYLPIARTGQGAYWSIMGNYIMKKNFFVLHGIGTTLHDAALSPLDAYRLDSKIDDGLPASGAAMSSNPAGGAIISVHVGGADTDCSSNDATTGIYNIATHPDAIVCNLVIESTLQ